MSRNVIHLSDIREVREWQRLLPLLHQVEVALNARTSSDEQRDEDVMISNQLKAIDCITQAKLLLLRALENHEAGLISSRDAKLKYALENDPAVVYEKDSAFWSQHINQFRCFNSKQRKAFYKKYRKSDFD